MLYFSKKNKEIKNLKNGGKKWPRTPIYKYYSGLLEAFKIESFSIIVNDSKPLSINESSPSWMHAWVLAMGIFISENQLQVHGISL